MKIILITLALITAIGCKEESENDKIKKEIIESLRFLPNKDYATKLSDEKITSVSEIPELKEICETIMKLIGDNHIKEAFDEMKKYTVLPSSEMDKVSKVSIKQIDLTKNRFGKLIGYEYISQECISKSVVKFTYIAKCNNHPLIWKFTFYKADKKWTLNHFYWNDKIENL